jgi:hypothetical protein
MSAKVAGVPTTMSRPVVVLAVGSVVALCHPLAVLERTNTLIVTDIERVQGPQPPCCAEERLPEGCVVYSWAVAS